MKEKLVWHNEKRKVNDLLEFSSNPRKMGEIEFGHLKKSIEENGYVEIIAINTDNKIVAGHMRVRALRELGRGEEEIDVRVPDRLLTEQEFSRYLLQSNQVHGQFDYDMLANHWGVEELTDWGFTPEQLGIADKSIVDTDNINNSLDSYLESNIRQVVLYYKAEDHQAVLQRLEAVLKEEKVEDYSMALLRLLDHYENNRVA